MADTPEIQALVTAAVHLNAAKYFQVASVVMLFYDHFITFGIEVERVWNRKITGASILFFLNRYLTPIQFILIVNAFNNPKWTGTLCDKFVSFEGFSTLALVAVCELIMILRVFALFRRNWYILAFLVFCLVVQITIGAIGLSMGFAAHLPPGFVGCIFTGPEKSLLPAIWFGPLITDAAIFVLTLWRTRAYFKHAGSGPTIQRLFQDGVLYFFLIFGANLLNVLIYIFAVSDIKPIGASFSQLITSVMISRLVLNLRDTGSEPLALTTDNGLSNVSFQSGNISGIAHDSFLAITIGNLGEDLQSENDHDRPRCIPSTYVHELRSMRTHRVSM